MIKKISTLFGAVVEAGMYFYLARTLAVYFLRIKHVFSVGTLMMVTLAIVLLWCASYLGTWVTISERTPKRFLKWFFLLDVCPGVLGALTAMAGLFR